jgi:hypothetical protein
MKMKMSKRKTVSSSKKHDPSQAETGDVNGIIQKVMTLLEQEGFNVPGGLVFLVDTAAYVATHAADTEEGYAEWKRAALKVLQERNWPWPTRDSGAIPGDPKGTTWAEIDDQLKQQGSSLQELVTGARDGRSTRASSGTAKGGSDVPS